MPAENALKAYLTRNNIPTKVAAGAIGVHLYAFYRYLLPLDSPRFRRPADAQMDAIHRFTKGAIGPADFYSLTPLEGDQAVSHETLAETAKSGREAA